MNALILSLFGLYILGLFTSMAAMEFFSSLLVLVALVVGIRRGRQGLSTLALGPDRWIWLYIAAVIMSAMMNANSPELRNSMIGWCRWVVLLYAFTWLLRVTLRPQLERWHWYFLFLTIPIGFNSIYQFFTGIDFTRPQLVLDHLGNYYRASGFFKMSLTFAYSLGMIGMTALAIALVRAADQDKKRAAYAAVTFLFVALSVFLSMTRGAWIAFAFATFVGVYLISRRWFLYLVPSTVFGLALIVLTNQTLRERLQSIFDGGNFSNSTRVLVWKANFLLFLDHPFFGIGFFPPREAFHYYYARLGAPDMDFYGHAHSDLMEMLSRIGIFGFVSYIVFCLFFLRLAYSLWKSLPIGQTWYRALALGSFLAQIYFHVGGLTQCNFTDGEVNHVLIFLWAATGAIAFQNQTQNQNEEVPA